MVPHLSRTVLAAALVLAAAPLAGLVDGCGSTNGFSTFDGGGDDGSASDVVPFGNDSSADTAPFNGPYSDFPNSPILDSPDGGAAAPPNAAQLFGPPTQGAQSGGPCLVEPEVGSLYPNNWLRPRFRWLPANGENLFELRVHAANQLNDLVVYTTQSSWTMPKAM